MPLSRIRRRRGSSASRAHQSPFRARLSASVPPEVNTTSLGWAPSASAIVSRDSSTVRRAARPEPCSDDALPVRPEVRGHRLDRRRQHRSRRSVIEVDRTTGAEEVITPSRVSPAGMFPIRRQIPGGSAPSAGRFVGPNEQRPIACRIGQAHPQSGRLASPQAAAASEEDFVTRLRIDDLTELAVPEQPVLSPDGSQVVYVLRTTDLKADRDLRNLWRVPAAGGEPRRLTRPTATARRSGRRMAPRSRSCVPRTVRRSCGCSPATVVSPSSSPPCPSGRGCTQVESGRDADRLQRTGRHRSRRGQAGQSAPIVTERLDYQADGVGWLGTSPQARPRPGARVEGDPSGHGG